MNLSDSYYVLNCGENLLLTMCERVLVNSIMIKNDDEYFPQLE